MGLQNTGWPKKHPKHLRTLCSEVEIIVEINQQESTYVVGKHLQICLGIVT